MVRIERLEGRQGEPTEYVEFRLVDDKIGYLKLCYFAQKSGEHWLAWENYRTAPAVLTTFGARNEGMGQYARDMAIEYALERAAIVSRAMNRLMKGDVK